MEEQTMDITELKDFNYEELVQERGTKSSVMLTSQRRLTDRTSAFRI